MLVIVALGNAAASPAATAGGRLAAVEATILTLDRSNLSCTRALSSSMAMAGTRKIVPTW